MPSRQEITEEELLELLSAVGLWQDYFRVTSKKISKSDIVLQSKIDKLLTELTKTTLADQPQLICSWIDENLSGKVPTAFVLLRELQGLSLYGYGRGYLERRIKGLRTIMDFHANPTKVKMEQRRIYIEFSKKLKCMNKPIEDDLSHNREFLFQVIQVDEAAGRSESSKSWLGKLFSCRSRSSLGSDDNFAERDSRSESCPP